MDFVFTDQYKSLSAIEWRGIPSLAILTGVNGTGKTQLLELIEAKVTRRGPDNIRKAATVTNVNVEHDQVLRLTADWHKLIDLYSVGVSDLQADSNQIWGQFVQWRKERRSETQDKRSYHDLFQAIVGKLGKKPTEIERTELLRETPTNLAMNRGEIFNSRFGKACVRYANRRLRMRGDGASDADVEAKYGPAPWVLLNEMLAEASMPFRVSDPSEFDSEDTFDCFLRNTSTDAIVRFPELSSGEQVIISLVFWLFNSDNQAVFPG